MIERDYNFVLFTKVTVETLKVKEWKVVIRIGFRLFKKFET